MIAARLITAAQLICAVIACIPLRWPPGGTYWGLLPASAGAVLLLWTLRHNRLSNFNILPELAEHAQLVTTGPYRQVRHPMYSALLLGAVGMALVHGTLAQLLAAVALIPVLLIKTSMEERHLRQQFPGYAEYAHRSGRFLPRFRS
ncbi:MAG: methyltransferase family protein [Planctomycetota bacterium]